jgi:hypothetical protein
MKVAKIIIAYILAIPSILAYSILVFFALREVLYRSFGWQSEMSKLYTLTDKQAIIYNSIDGSFDVIVVVVLIKWLYKKKYNWIIIASFLVWIIFFIMAHIEGAWRR